MLKVDWEGIPDEIKYVAMDKNGEWWGYRDEPTRRNTHWQSLGEALYFPDHNLFTSWGNSLIARPESNELKTWCDVVNAILDGEKVMRESTILDTPVCYNCLPDVNIEDLDNPLLQKHWIVENITIEGGVIHSGDYYFVPYHLDKERPYKCQKWSGSEFDQHCLDNKLACKTKELAIEKTNQLLTFLKEG